MTFEVAVLLGLIGLVAASIVTGRHPPGLAPPAPPPPPPEPGTVRVRIAELRPGEWGKVIGTIVEGGGLRAPVSGRPCVAFDVIVTRPDDGADPAPVRRGTRGARFVIDDGSGRITVEPRGAYVRVTHDRTIEPGELPGCVLHDRALVAELPAPERLRVREGVLAVGERVMVTGLVTREGDPGGGYRTHASARLVLTGGPHQPATVSELPVDRGDTARFGSGVSIDVAEPGQRVRLVGRITGGGRLYPAPFSGRRCVYLQVRLEHDTGRAGWKTVLTEPVRTTIFTIDDGTGRAAIDLARATVRLDPGRVRTGEPDPDSPAVRELLARHQLAGLPRGRLRYQELALALDDLVAAVGVGVRELDPDAVGDITGPPDPDPPRRLRLAATSQHALHVTDAPDRDERWS